MMKITVRIFGDLVQFLGNKISLELEEGSTVGALVKAMGERSGQRRQGYLGDFKVGGGELIILVNGRNIELADGLETIVREGEDIVFLNPTMGG